MQVIIKHRSKGARNGPSGYFYAIREHRRWVASSAPKGLTKAQVRAAGLAKAAQLGCLDPEIVDQTA